jgi:uncharacterized membrane protein YkoI
MGRIQEHGEDLQVGKRILQAVALLLVLVVVAPVVGAKAAAQLDRSEAIRLAQREAARTTQVAATSQVKGSGQWTVTLKQEGAKANDRIYVMLNANGEVEEEGWLKDGVLRPVKVTKERATAIAKQRIGIGSRAGKAGLVLTTDTLTWEVVVQGRNGRLWTVVVDAFSGKVAGSTAGTEEPAIISRSRAIAIARSEVWYKARLVAADLTEYRGAAAWKIELTRENSKVYYHDIFYIDAIDGEVLAHRSEERQPANTISKSQAVTIALKRVGVPCKLEEAKLDNWQGQDVWVITLVEEKNPSAWHIVILQADGSFRQEVSVK